MLVKVTDHEAQIDICYLNECTHGSIYKLTHETIHGLKSRDYKRKGKHLNGEIMNELVKTPKLYKDTILLSSSE